MRKLQFWMIKYQAPPANQVQVECSGRVPAAASDATKALFNGLKIIEKAPRRNVVFHIHLDHGVHKVGGVWRAVYRRAAKEGRNRQLVSAQRFQLSERAPNNLLRGADFGRQVAPNADPDIHRKADQLVNSGKFVHCLNKNGHVLWVHTRRDAVPEVEDMPGTFSVIPEDSLDLCPDNLRLRIQN